jgi:NADH dehydrogenase FAD-containing subunit
MQDRSGGDRFLPVARGAFIVGGGGFSGVEVMAELNDFVRSVKGNYLRLRNVA